ncbi:MAG: CBS domain-containing protein [Thermoanaerobaculia bacterium]
MRLVKDVLEGKGREVWVVGPDQTVFDALNIMAEHEIGALLVRRDDEVIGIVSERDYARKVILQGKSSQSTPVGEIMTSELFRVGPRHSVDECMALMTAGHVRHLPVFDNDKLVGIVSIGDLVKAVMEDQKFTIEQLENYIAR